MQVERETDLFSKLVLQVSFEDAVTCYVGIS